MPTELNTEATTGLTVYAVILNSADKYWNGSDFETFTTGSFSTYAVALAETGASGWYQGSFPTGITTAGIYDIQFRRRVGSSAAQSDPFVGTGQIDWSGEAESSPATSGVGGLNLTQSRALVRQFARNAQDDSMYSDADIDRAIQAIADDFLRATKAIKQTDNLALTADAAAIGTLPDNFRPERALSAWIPSYGRLEIIDHDTILDQQINNASTDLPTKMAFDSWTTGSVWPTPDADYTAKLLWSPPFTIFTAGTDTDPGELNIPADWMRTILIYGATALLQHHEPEHAFSGESYKKYMAFRDGLRGAGGRGEKTIYRRLTD